MKSEKKILTAFQQFLNSNSWFEKKERVLLAVSGGIDSMVMVDLFRRSELDFGVAHCNFQLRGEASNRDEELVAQLAEKWKIPFYVQRFPTNDLAQERKTSIQVLARELRYEWLEKIRVANGYQWIATAHHINDSIETVLYNWTKGTGVRGLLGIPWQNDRVIRPLMFASRIQLEEYVETQALLYRTDASNLKDKYSRNKIRQHVLPVLKQINPSLEKTFQASQEQLKEVAILYDWALENLRSVWTKKIKDEFQIAIEPLRDFPAAQTLLFEWLKEYHFSNRQTAQVYNSLHHEPGAVFYSSSHRLLLDRDCLVVVPLAKLETQKVVPVVRADQTINLPEGCLSVRMAPGKPEKISTAATDACLDADCLKFPLHLRRWQAGDRFKPLGMNGQHQKLQDFFSNQKISLFEKEDIWLLTSGDGEIAWVVGLRIAETFKITDKTKTHLRLHFEKM